VPSKRWSVSARLSGRETITRIFESLTDTYGEKMVSAFREQFGDERAISTLLSMRDAVSYSRVYPGMESN
jgi:hypothetical protein